MRLQFSNGYIDYEMRLFREIAEPLRARLALLTDPPDKQYAAECGWDDSAEHIMGIILVAAQNYIVSAASQHQVTKTQALSLGPIHRSGHRVVELLNHCANFWKHADEWNWGQPDGRREAILRAFETLSLPETSMPLCDLVAEICGTHVGDLEELCSNLLAWREALEKAYPTS
jgi:hypothetical protein